MDPHVRELAMVLWEYHQLHHELQKSGAELYLEGWAPWLMFSGGLGRLTLGKWDRPEAEVFADVAAQAGVPRDRILIENQSTNTSENVLFSRRVLRARRLTPRRVLAVHKPYMERRTYAVFQTRWPDVEVRVASPLIDFDAYPNGEISADELVNVIVGDLQRLKVYPPLGYLVEQDIPDEVWRAYEELVRLGYDRHLV
jgi:uncharacterized SAM-binding protein YcdF (DUF218 family)